MSTSRREFLKSGVTVACGLALADLTKVAHALPNGQPFGFQTFEIFKDLTDNWQGTWNAMASYGYSYADLDYWGPIGNYTPEQINDSLAKAGLTLSVVHYPYDQLTGDKYQKSIDDAHKLKGAKYITLTAVAGRPAARDHKPSSDDWKWLADELNRLGGEIQKAGFGFAYHNHAQELQATTDGKMPMDVLMENTDPKLVKYQFDVGNAAAGGGDPIHYLEAYPGRYMGLHVKDYKQGMGAIPLGVGTVDLKRVFEIAKKQNITNFVAEVGAFGAGGGRGGRPVANASGTAGAPGAAPAAPAMAQNTPPAIPGDPQNTLDLFRLSADYLKKLS